MKSTSLSNNVVLTAWLSLTNRVLAKVMQAEDWYVPVQFYLAFAHQWFTVRKVCLGRLLPLDSGAQNRCSRSRSEPSPEPTTTLNFMCILKQTHPAEIQIGSAKSQLTCTSLSARTNAYCCKPLSLVITGYSNRALGTRYVTGAQQHRNNRNRLPSAYDSLSHLIFTNYGERLIILRYRGFK